MTNLSEIVASALNARTAADIEALEAALHQALPGCQQRDLGDNAVNWSSVSSAGDPAALLMERTTNMFDAEIVGAAFGLDAPTWQNPAEAVRDLFDIPDGVENLPEARRAELAQRCSLTLLDSDDSARTPTIAFRDHGIGITPEEMPTTILSLHGSNKLDTPYLHGVFGKGGSSTSQYSYATVIVSRRQPAHLPDGAADRISVAVIRLDDSPLRRLEYFRYLVDGSRTVFNISAAEYPDFEPGTYVCHVNYHGERLGTQKWEYEESIYAVAETILFSPTLPYQLADRRSGEANTRPADRQGPSTLGGLGGRLKRSKADKILDQTNWTRLEVPGVGTIRLRWWLFEGTDARRRRAAKGYVTLFTTNGQVHHSWDQAKLIQLLPDKPRIAKSILIQVDCDDLPLKTRARIFDTFRTQTRQSPEARALEAAVVEELRGDPDLRQHEESLVAQALGSSGGADISPTFLRKLNQAITIKQVGVVRVPADVSDPPPPAVPEDLYEEPTYLTGPEHARVLVGGRTAVFLQANANDGFVPLRGSIEVTSPDGPLPCTFAFGDLRRGRMRIGITAHDNTQPGVYPLDFDLTWIDDHDTVKVLTWTVKVEVVTELPAKTSSNSNNKVADSGSIAFMWARLEEFDQRIDVAGKLELMSGRILAEKSPSLYKHLKNLDSVPTIVMNEKFKDWAAYYEKIVKSKSDETASARKERYGIAVGSAVATIWSAEQRLERAAQEAADDGRSIDEHGMTVEQRHRAVTQAARTALVLLPDFDT